MEPLLNLPLVVINKRSHWYIITFIAPFVYNIADKHLISVYIHQSKYGNFQLCTFASMTNHKGTYIVRIVYY